MNELKSLNSNLLNESSIEELEERLELAAVWGDCSDGIISCNDIDNINADNGCGGS